MPNTHLDPQTNTRGMVWHIQSSLEAWPNKGLKNNALGHNRAKSILGRRKLVPQAHRDKGKGCMGHDVTKLVPK